MTADFILGSNVLYLKMYCCNENIVALTKYSPLDQFDPGAASDENVVKITTFPYESDYTVCQFHVSIYILLICIFNRQVNIDNGNDFTPTESKPLPQPMI